MTAQELIQTGRLTETVDALNREVREKPEDPRLRVFLFQLNCVLGRFEKALAQLQVLASLNSETMMLAQIFRPVIACELLRTEVFAGRRTPLVFGEPLEWIGQQSRTAALAAEGRADAALEARNLAFEAAPATAGTINGKPFEWIADGDSRLGPILEVILEGKYYWVPYCRITRIDIEKPTDLRDLVWVPAQFTWSNAGQMTGHIPVRYPGTEKSNDDALRLARKTDWKDAAPDFPVGLGQRVLVTDVDEYPLLECRRIELRSTS